MFLRSRAVLLSLALLACHEPATSPVAAPRLPAVNDGGSRATLPGAATLIATGGTFAESSYLACLYSYYRQGLGLSQVQSLCVTQLTAQAAVGFGGDGAGFDMPARAGDGFDAAAIASACGIGDGTVAAAPAGSARYVEHHLMFAIDKSGAITSYLVPIDYGSYSWGRKGEPAGDGKTYKGLTKAEAEAIKAALVATAEDVLAQLENAEAELADDPFNLKKRQKVEELRAYYAAAKKGAEQDPNKGREAEGSTCATVMQAAREVLAECHRTGWKDMTCQVLQARMERCPDPTRIYVDPDAGYSCMPVIDPALVIEAWTRKCEEITTSGPEGGSPCSKPEPSGTGRTLSANEKDLCRNTVAHTDGENDGCIAELQVDTFGDTDVHGLIVWGQGVFGGPLVVLPPPPPPVVPRG